LRLPLPTPPDAIESPMNELSVVPVTEAVTTALPVVAAVNVVAAIPSAPVVSYSGLNVPAEAGVTVNRTIWLAIPVPSAATVA